MTIQRRSAGPPSGGVIQLPTVRLDTTLTDLFRLACPKDAHKRLAYLHSPAHCAVSLGPHVRRNTTFLYQDGSFVNAPLGDLSPCDDDDDDDDEGEEGREASGRLQLRRSLAAKLLGVVPQRDAFITGPSAAVLFDASADPAEARRAADEAEATVAVLEVAQRPALVRCPGPCCLPLAEAGVDLVAGYKMALDGLAGRGYPLAIGLEAHWLLNSKRALALSGLPTPRTDVIEVSGCPVPAGECCDACRRDELGRGLGLGRGRGRGRSAGHDAGHDAGGHDAGMISTIPAGCGGQRGAWFREHEGRIISEVEGRSPPFAFKTQQTLGGGGTWIVGSERDKRQLLQHLASEDGIVRKLLPQLREANAHLRPGSMLLSELVRDPVGNYGVTFYVTDAGGVIFMGVSEQILAGDGKAWAGSTISYRSQQRLQDKLRGLAEQTAQWLSEEHRYCGPVGMDVLEARADGRAGTGGRREAALFIVDLNVRTSGSMSLPLLRGHFTSRGLYCSGMCTITTRKGRWEFVDQWRSQFLSGSMIILSWCRDPLSEVSTGCVITGAEDEARLGERMEALKASTDEVTF